MNNRLLTQDSGSVKRITIIFDGLIENLSIILTDLRYYSHAVHDGAETIEDNRKILPKGARDFFTTRKLIGYEYTDLSQKAKADIVQVLREEDNLPASSNSSIHFLPNTPPSKLKQISRNSIQVQKTMNIAEPSDDVLDEDSHTDVDNIASDALVQDKEIMASRAESVSVVGAPVNPRDAMINLEESQRPRGRKSIRGKQSYRPRSPILAGCTRVLNATNEDLPSSATSSLAKNIPVVSRSIASTTTNSRGLDRTLVNTSDPEVNVKSSTTDTIQRYLDGLPDIDELGAPKQTSLTSRPGQQLTNTFQEKLTGGVKARPNAPKDISPVIVEISDDEVVSISKYKTMAKRAKATKDKAQSSANNLSSKYYGKSTRGIRGSRAAEEDLEDSTPKSASSQTRQELMTPRPRTKENGVPRISVSPLTMASSNQDSFSQKPQCKDNEKNKSHHPVRVAAESQESCYVTRDVKLRKAAVQIDRSRAPTTGPRVLIVDDNSLSGKEDDEKEEEHPSFENPKDGIAPAPPLVQKSTQPIPKPVSRFKPKVPKHRRQPNVTADSLRDAVAKNGMARVNGPPSRSAIVVDRENGAHCRPFEMSRAEPPKTVPQYSISYRDERSPTAQNPTSHGRMTSGGELTTGLRANGSGSAYRHEEISMIGPWTPSNKTQVKRTSVNRKRSHESPPDEPSRKKPAQKKDNGQTSSISALPSNSSFNPPTGPKAWRDGSQGGPSARPDN